MKLDAITIATLAVHGIRLEYDDATGTFELCARDRERADRLAPDGTLSALTEARELHKQHHDRRRMNMAHGLLLLVHIRGIELRMPAMCEAAANVCLESLGCKPIRSARASC